MRHGGPSELLVEEKQASLSEMQAEGVGLLQRASVSRTEDLRLSTEAITVEPAAHQLSKKHTKLLMGTNHIFLRVIQLKAELGVI